MSRPSPGLKGRPIALVSVLCILILSEYIVSWPTFPLVTPDWYKQLAQEPGLFAVLDIPMRPRALPDKEYMFYQFVHGKPLVEGHVSRPPREAFTFIESVPLLKNLRPENKPDPDIVNVSHQLRLLDEANIRYLILHKKFLPPEDLVSWKDWLILEPYHEDADLVVYRTAPVLGRDFSLAHEMTVDAGGRVEIGLIQATFVPTATVQEGWVQINARWGSGVAVNQDYDVCLNLVDVDNEIAQSHCEPLAPTWPTSQWQANEIVRASYTFQTGPFLETGTYTVTMTLVDSVSGVIAGRPAAVGALHFEAIPRVFDAPEPTVITNVAWGDVIFLLGYDLSLSSRTIESLITIESLDVTLYWQAKRRTDASYKVFLHLTDATTGNIVMQADVVPRNWTYPTHWWERGEFVKDIISLSLNGVPPGQYELLLGLYDAATGERLPAYSADGGTYPDNVVLLMTVQR
jgi:hypothetical protein